jgi:hypothetical protein
MLWTWEIRRIALLVGVHSEFLPRWFSPVTAAYAHIKFKFLALMDCRQAIISIVCSKKQTKSALSFHLR